MNGISSSETCFSSFLSVYICFFFKSSSFCHSLLLLLLLFSSFHSNQMFFSRFSSVFVNTIYFETHFGHKPAVTISQCVFFSFFLCVTVSHSLPANIFDLFSTCCRLFCIHCRLEQASEHYFRSIWNLICLVDVIVVVSDTGNMYISTLEFTDGLIFFSLNPRLNSILCRATYCDCHTWRNRNYYIRFFQAKNLSYQKIEIRLEFLMLLIFSLAEKRDRFFLCYNREVEEKTQCCFQKIYQTDHWDCHCCCRRCHSRTRKRKRERDKEK